MSSGRRPVVSVTRTETFCAAHRLHSWRLSDEENERTFGPCNRANGHGHNYSVEVTLRGEVDPDTGMVCNLSDLKRIMREAIVDVCDHKNLDRDVDYFRQDGGGKTSTVENLTVFVWERLEAAMDRPELLHEVKVRETDNNSASYFGK